MTARRATRDSGSSRGSHQESRFPFASTKARQLAVVTALVLAVSAGCGIKEKTGRAAAPPGHGFVFTVNQGGWNEIFVMDEQGNNRRRLTETAPAGANAAGNTSPKWSPDGKRIAFVSTGDALEEDENTAELYVMDADGSNKIRLTTNDVADGSPDWSPDGKHLAFVRAKNWGSENVEVALYVMDADGSNERVLRRETSGTGPIFLSTPRWSPDGSRIAYTRSALSEESAKVSLMTIGSDGNEAIEIARDAGEPAWSPDGNRIAFTSNSSRFGETCFHECQASGEIYVARSDGGDPRRLTTSEADDAEPAWSPDGKRIAFVSDRSDRDGHEYEIYVVSSEGGDPVRITNNSVWDQSPDWRG